MEPGSWLCRSCSRNVFWGEVSPVGSGGREDASCRFRACLAWLPGLLLRAVVPPAPPREDQGRALHHQGGQKAWKGRGGSRVMRPETISHPKQGPDSVAKSKLSAPRHQTLMLAFSFGGIQEEGGPWPPVSAAGTPAPHCCRVAVSLTGFPGRLTVHTTSFLGPVSGQGAQGLARGEHDGLGQDTWASVPALELSSWASVWLLSFLELERDHFLPQSPLDPEELGPVSRFFGRAVATRQFLRRLCNQQVPATQTRVFSESRVCSNKRSYGWQVTREPSVST